MVAYDVDIGYLSNKIHINISKTKPSLFCSKVSCSSYVLTIPHILLCISNVKYCLGARWDQHAMIDVDFYQNIVGHVYLIFY